MITVTSLQHPNFQCRLHGAMVRAATMSRTTFNGAGFHDIGNIAVMHFRGDVTGHTGFMFMRGLDDITATVLKALRS